MEIMIDRQKFNNFIEDFARDYLQFNSRVLCSTEFHKDGDLSHLWIHRNQWIWTLRRMANSRRENSGTH